jgi:hypothetical protein
MKITNQHLDFPGVCHVCDSAPRDDQKVVDTEREFYDNGDDVIGRKYVCDECVKALAELLGYVHEDTFRHELVQLENEIKKLRAFEESIAAIMPKENNIVSA